LSHSVITLLSDLGTRDASVTIAKTVLLRYVPGTTIVDISHNVEQYDLQQAAYLLLSAYRHFPAGTVHIVPVDVFSTEKPRMLLAQHDGYYFIAPDNGVLPLAFGAALQDTRLCFEFSKPFSFSEWINKAGQVIELIAAGRDMPYPTYEVKKAPRIWQPKAMPDGVDCNILYIDRYENVVLDITRDQFNEMVRNRPFRIKVMRLDDITTISHNYNDVPEGEPLCRFNNAGFLEIALNHGPAASLLGLRVFNTSNVRYQTIKIFFGARQEY
jgi:S-adenosyl-L-methionine hydrolase (adenosine-forming)